MGIQLGLTDSLRCQLPSGTDGTGYWELTVYAMGYEDYTYKFQATEENIVKPEAGEISTTELEAAIAKAEALKESDYTSDSWAAMQTELQEAKDLAVKVEEKPVKLTMKTGKGGKTFGTISTKEVAAAVKEQLGLEVDKKKMKLDEPIKTLGTHIIALKLHKDVTAKLTVKVVEK